MGIFIAALLAAWRLSTGPVSLSFITPMLQSSLNELHDGSFAVTLDNTVLTWAGWERTLDIRMVNMRASLPSGGEIASIPEVSLSFSAKALLQGTIAPKSIEFFGPNLLVVRDTEGNFALGFEGSEEDSGQFATRILGAMLQEEVSSNPMSYLTRVNVVSGQLTYFDNSRGITFHAPVADAKLSRIESGLEADINIGIDVAGEIADISVLGTFDAVSGRFDVGLSFDSLNLSSFSEITPEIEYVSAIDLPVSGTLTLSASPNGTIEGVGFDLSGGNGHVSLPVPLAAKMDMLTLAQRIKVDGFKAVGRFEGEGNNIEMNTLEVELADKETFYLPAPLDLDLPLKKIGIAGRYIGGDHRLEIDNSEIDLGGPVAKIRAKVNGVTLPASGETSSALSLGLSGALHGMRLEGLERFWPKVIAPDAREWVLSHMPHGVSPKAEIVVSLVSDEGGVRFEKLKGTIEGEGVTVNYLPPMPGISNVKGRVTFDSNSLNIKTSPTKNNEGITLKSSDINFTKLDTDDPEADFKLELEGPIAASLALIDHDPFNFAREIGIDPTTTSGNVTTNLDIHFPFKKDLTVKDVTASATAQLLDAGFSGILFGRDLTLGNLKLDVNSEALSAVGTAKLGGVPIGLLWRHDFAAEAIFRDKYELTGRIDNVLELGDMGITVPKITENYISGGAEANVSYTIFGDDRRSLSARVDLANTRMNAPELGWAKEQGIPAAAVLELRLNGDKPSDIPTFEISAPEMEVKGSAAFRDDGELEVVNVSKIITNRTSVSGSLVPHDDGTWEVSLMGDEFDASLLWDDFLGIGDTSSSEDLDEVEFVFSGAADFRTLWFGKDRAVHDFIGTIYREGKLWKKVDMEGRVSDTETINIRLETYEDRNERRFGILSNNAGAALKALDIYDLALGGKLRMEATYKGTDKNAPLSGTLTVHDYALKEAPALADLVGVLSLTGILDALKGEGLNFDILEVPFSLNRGVLTVKDGRTSGPSIGITATGDVNLGGKRIDIEGTVVPAYAINSLLENIPIIGTILSGPEKGSGIFAATYSMKSKGDEVEINFNPMSALAPGLLRRIFSGSGREKEISPKE